MTPGSFQHTGLCLHHGGWRQVAIDHIWYHRSSLGLSLRAGCRAGADIILGGSGGEGDPSGEVATLLVLVIALLRGNCSEPRTSSAPSGGGAAVLDVAHAPGHLTLVTVTRLPEALLEVVREEGVEHGVNGRVGVLEAVRKQDYNHQGVALVEAGLLIDEGDLSDPVGKPADDVDSDHCEDQLGHLPVALPLALRPLLSPGPHRPQLDDHLSFRRHYRPRMIGFGFCGIIELRLANLRPY